MELTPVDRWLGGGTPSPGLAAAKGRAASRLFRAAQFLSAYVLPLIAR